MVRMIIIITIVIAVKGAIRNFLIRMIIIIMVIAFKGAI